MGPNGEGGHPLIERHKPKRRNMFAETRMLGEYLPMAYPGATWFLKLRVGRPRREKGAEPIDEGEINLARNFNRWADAVVVTPGEIVVIEAKMWDPSNAIGKLKEYMILARSTPELEIYASRPLVGEVVTAQHDPLAERIIRESGLRYVHYEPPWMDEFYAIYPDRRRTPAGGLPDVQSPEEG